jgi:hypothetical protein
MAVLVPFFQQFTGINVIMFYAPVLFKTIGLGGDASLMSAFITGLVNIVATFVSIATVDGLGRRKLFFQGGCQMLICQVVIGTLIGVEFGASGDGDGDGAMPKNSAATVVAFICIYVAGFAWSWGPLGTWCLARSSFWRFGRRGRASAWPSACCATSPSRSPSSRCSAT